MVRILDRCLTIVCMPRKKRQSFPICEQQSHGTKHQHQINKLFVRRVESIRVTHQGVGLKRLPVQTIRERQCEQKKTKTKAARPKIERVVRPDDTEFDCETHISDRQTKPKHRTKTKKKSSPIEDKPKETTPSRSPFEKLFHRKKKSKTPSPSPSSIDDIPEEENNHDHDNDDDGDTDSLSSTSSSSSSSTASDWSSTTSYPDSQSSEKSDEDLALPPNQLREVKHRSCIGNFSFDKNNHSSSEQQQQQSKRSSAKSKQVLQNVRNMMKDQSVQDQHFNDTRQRESVRL